MKALLLNLFYLLIGIGIGMLSIYYQKTEKNGAVPIAGSNTERSPDLTTPPTLQEFATFPTAILQATGKKVLPYEGSDSACTEVKDAILRAAQDICKELNAEDSPTIGLRRINEASNHVENLLLEKLNQLDDITCEIPKNAKGNEQRSGYPDLHLTHITSGKHFYLDPKLYEKTSESSSLRTFYFSPTSKSGKIHYHARHLLLGIHHDGNDGNWKFHGFKLIDLSALSLKLKSEYNASNVDLYQEDRIISQGKN